jgi:hypothetical protein
VRAHAFLSTFRVVRRGALARAVNIPVADMGPQGPVPLPGFVAAVNEAFPDKSQKFIVGRVGTFHGVILQ